jgi:hypothetical protein
VSAGGHGVHATVGTHGRGHTVAGRQQQSASARGAASLVVEAIGVAKATGATGQILVRSDSAFYVGKVVSACRRHGVRVSVTAKTSPALRRAIAAIDESRWVPIRYPNAIFDEETRQWISEAEIAETTYTAFAGTRHAYTARLIVRRIPHRDPNQVPGQGELTPRGAITRSSPTTRPSLSRPRPTIVATPWSNRSSPISSTARSHTCPPMGSGPTAPGWPAPGSPTISSGPPDV